MGVYNPFAELPNSCVLCDSKEKCDLHVGYWGRSVGRHKDCPLVEIPVPHGRLIDENAVMREFAQRDNFSEKTLVDFLMEAPTIIEAEGKDDATQD